MRALKIFTDGNCVVEDLNGDLYHEISTTVSGMVEAVTLDDAGSMYINEEGKLYNLPVNEVATRLFKTFFPWSNDYIVGNAILFGPVDNMGEETQVTPEIIRMVQTICEGK